MRPAAALLALLCTLPSLSATIEVKVVGPQGEPVPNARVGIEAPVFSPRVTRDTDERGIVTLDRVGVGHWAVWVEPPSGSGLFAPGEGGTFVTVRTAQERIPLVVTLKTGAIVRANVVGDYVPERSAIRLRGGTGPPREMVLDRSGRGSIPIGPGLWAVSPEPPAGLAWIAVTVDGKPCGSGACFESLGAGSTHQLEWTFARPGTVGGRVSISGRSQRVWIVARLRQEGPWAPAMRAGGWFPDRVVTIGLKPDGTFERDLAEGSWELEVKGDEVLEVDPPSVTVDLVPGAQATVSFRVKTGGESGPKRGVFAVRVSAADGKPVHGAKVEVRALRDGLPDGPPVASGNSVDGQARLEALVPKGDYVVAATHEGSLWASVVVKGVAIDEGDTVSADVTLRRGGAVGATVGEDSAVRPALELLRVDPPVPTPFSTAFLGDVSSRRMMRIDARGVGHESGLEPGRFRVTLGGGGPGSESRLVRMRLPGGVPADELDLDVKDGETTSFEIVDEPAASATAKIECDDGTAVDKAFRIRGYREDAVEPTYEEYADPREDRRLLWGPIPPGRWRFEIEPASFARRTWAPGTEIPADAQTYTLEADGVPNDLGTIRVDCAPAVRLTIDVEPAADLRLARIEGRWRENDDAPWQPLKGLSVVAAEDFLLVHRLPEGEGTVELTLKHPHLLDEPVAVAILKGKRYRGGLHQAVAEAAGLGGAIRYSAARRLKLTPRAAGVLAEARRRSGTAEAFEPGADSTSILETADLEPRIVPVDPDWGAAVSVAPGVYDVVACGEPDPDCERARKLWTGVRVTPGSTTELR